MRRRKEIEKNVFEATKDRIRYLYSRFDNVVVSFSGGKDSTAALHITREVAKELGRGPVHVVFFDEEAIHPPTIEYVERVRREPDVKLEWYCLPLQKVNACSTKNPYWYPWNPEKKDLWVRPLPEDVITDHPRFKKELSFQEFSEVLFYDIPESFVFVTGVRAQESYRRQQIVLAKKNDNYISRLRKNVAHAHPLYDWKSEDVWRLVTETGIDYNKTYDILNKTKLYNSLLFQRVAPPYGQESIQNLWFYAECWPEMWHKMLNRVPGVATAWRYAKTELYGVGDFTKPEELTWKQYLNVIVKRYGNKERKIIRRNINDIIKKHYDKTDLAIPEESNHPLTGVCWKDLCKIATRGDLKGRAANNFDLKAIRVREKLGIESYEEALKIYGKKK